MLPERLAVLPRLALADLRHEWGMALCYVAALAAILTPLLVLDGLRAGVIQGLTDELTSNPSKLRIHLPGTLALNPETVAAIGALDGVGYIEPMSRSIAARLLLAGPGGAVDTIDLLPSSAGDPLLRRTDALAPGEIALSTDLAERFGVGPGDRLTGHASRTGRWPARLALPFEVVEVVPGDFLIGRQALVAPAVADRSRRSATRSSCRTTASPAGASPSARCVTRTCGSMRATWIRSSRWPCCCARASACRSGRPRTRCAGSRHSIAISARCSR